MNTLKNQKYKNYGYQSRYNSIPYYYDTLTDRSVYGVGGILDKNVPYVSHKVMETDNLDKLALKYYNNPTYWWIIAMFNDIPDALAPLFPRYKVIQIPNLASIKFIKESR